MYQSALIGIFIGKFMGETVGSKSGGFKKWLAGPEGRANMEMYEKMPHTTVAFALTLVQHFLLVITLTNHRDLTLLSLDPVLDQPVLHRHVRSCRFRT